MQKIWHLMQLVAFSIMLISYALPIVIYRSMGWPESAALVTWIITTMLASNFLTVFLCSYVDDSAAD